MRLGRINDALGRTVGDQLLQRIAKRLASCVQTESGGELSSEQHNPTLYRFDGDEFAIVVPYMEGVHSAAAFINKLLEDATVSFQRSGAPELFVTCSVGVSVFPADGMDPDLPIRNAGLALRHAKQAGRHRYEFFSPPFNEMAQALDLSAELRHAIGRDEIELLYEPRLAGGRLVGAQTVVRWRHGSGRVIEGDELMDLAATTEMSMALTEWMLQQLRDQIKDWRAAASRLPRVGVTVDLDHITPPQVCDILRRAIRGGLQPQYLAVEFRGGADVEPAQDDLEAFAGLKRMGVRFDCQWACPAHTPVPEYIRLIAHGRYSDAYMINWKSNVFPGILGRTCDRPCEPACRRSRVEDETWSRARRSRSRSAVSSASPPTTRTTRASRPHAQGAGRRTASASPASAAAPPRSPWRATSPCSATRSSSTTRIPSSAASSAPRSRTSVCPSR